VKSYFVKLTLPDGLSAQDREPFSLVVTTLAARFSFQGLEDWSVDVKNSRVLGAETEFHDLTRAGRPKPEMRAYFGRENDARTFALILRKSFADLRVATPRALAPRDWMKEWRKHYKMQRLREGKSTLAIVPAWKKAPRGPHVRITPGQAFGTGTHPTTRLCLELLLKHGANSRRVLDFGAGTGILLVAAQKLAGPGGSTRAPRPARYVAVESDPVALAQCRKNARLNRARGLKFSRTMPRGRFDLVFANVLAPVLLAHKRKLHAAIAPGGLIFLSGILRTEAHEFLAKFRGRLLLVEERVQGDWAALALRA
jgi:ribosomal protein L11 methyltransferase